MRQPIICHLCNFSPEYPGSFIDSLLFLARHCREELKVDTLCIFPEQTKNRPWLQRLTQERVLYDFVPRQRLIVFDLWRLLRDYDPLVIHSHFYTFDIAALLAKLLLYRKSKVVIHFHSVGRSTFLQRVKDIIKVKILARKLGDRFIVVGDGALLDTLERGFPQGKVVLIRNGIDTNRFGPSDLNSKNFDAASVGSEWNNVFLLLGYSPVTKGVDVFVKAALEMTGHSRQKNLFLIVGRKETRDFVSRLPESSKLGSSLRLIEPIETFAAFLTGINVLVSASRSEGFSYTIAEAMAAGKLILCSDAPGMREIYGRSKGVWFYEGENWRKLAELMQRVEELPEIQQKQLGHLNRAYVVEHLALEEWTRKVGLVYSTLLQGSSSAKSYEA